MSWWRAALSAGLLVGGLQTVAAADPVVTTQHAPTASVQAVGLAADSPLIRKGRIATISRSPFGLSLEYPLMERALGSGACPSHALAATVRELGSPALRIGGDSQDLAGPSAAYHYVIPLGFWTTLGCLARETGAPIVVGLNFAESPVADELGTITAAEQAIPAAQLSFSLGNEPDLYGLSHILPNEPGIIVPAFRPSPWTAEEFASEWTSRRAMLGQIPLEGPDLAGIGWRGPMTQMLRSDPPVAMTVHAYPTVACGSAGAPTTAARLLTKHASVGLVEKYAWLLAVAQAAHTPAVISESNSGSCGGKPGVSDTPVAGVWAARYVVAAMLAGFAQVRFHTAGTSYDAFAFQADGSVAIRPLGHALLFLHRWIPVGSRIESISSNPQVLAARISDGKHTSVILSSFSPKPTPFTIDVQGTDRPLHTDALITASTEDGRGLVTVSHHRIRLVLGPDVVLAFKTG
jgi:hypothetical protein